MKQLIFFLMQEKFPVNPFIIVALYERGGKG